MTDNEMTRRLLSRLVRIGTVMTIDAEKRMVRVKYQNENMPSGWLYVLQHYDADLYIEPDGAHSHKIEAAGGHNHPSSSLTISQDGDHTHGLENAGEHTHEGTVTEGETGGEPEGETSGETGEESGGEGGEEGGGEQSVEISPAGDHTHTAANAGGHNHPGSTLSISQDGNHTHTAGGAYYGENNKRTHSHSRSFVTWWLPKVDDAVLCLCLPTDDGDGYVLGGI